MDLRSRRTLPALLVSMLLALLVSLAGPVSSASAWSYTIASPLSAVGELTFARNAMIYAVASAPLVFESGPLTVHASPAVQGPQTVNVQITLQRLDGAQWTDFDSSEWFVGHLSGSTTWTVGSWRSSIPKTSPAKYRMAFTVQWKDDKFPQGAVASAQIVPSSQIDVACNAAGCNSFADGLVI